MGYRTWNDVAGVVNVTYMKAMVDAVTSRKRLVDGKPTSLLDLGYGRVGLDAVNQSIRHEALNQLRQNAAAITKDQKARRVVVGARGRIRVRS